MVRDLINQMKTSTNPDYCVRVTANDGERGETHLREFQDNEKTIPTILTTSQKLSTGVDARKARTIQHMMMTNFWHPDGTPMSSQQFMEMLSGRLPEFFHDEAELRTLSRPWEAGRNRTSVRGVSEVPVSGA